MVDVIWKIGNFMAYDIKITQNMQSKYGNKWIINSWAVKRGMISSWDFRKKKENEFLKDPTRSNNW